MLKSVASETDGFIEVTNCLFADGNGSGFNFDFTHHITGCTFSNLDMAMEFYTGYMLNPSVFENSTITGTRGGIVLVGALTNQVMPAYTIRSNAFTVAQSAILLGPAQNVSVMGNEFFGGLGVGTDSYAYQGTTLNSNILVAGNLFHETYLPINIYGNGPDRLVNLAVISNTAWGCGNFAAGGGTSTNVLFLGNQSLADANGQRGGLNSQALLGQWYLDDLSNDFPPWHDNDTVGQTNIITYALGMRHETWTSVTNSVYVIDTQHAAQIPPGAKLLITHAGQFPATFLLPGTNGMMIPTELSAGGSVALQLVNDTWLPRNQCLAAIAAVKLSHFAGSMKNQVHKPARLIYFSPESYGGLADYAHEQARALRQLGAEVIFLTTPIALSSKLRASYHCEAEMEEARDFTVRRSWLARRFRTLRCILGNVRRLERRVRQEEARVVLMGSYAEYLAPIWAPRLRRLSRSGVVFGGVVHDPVRDFVVGPAWWHSRSIACGYSFLREAFVHEPIELDTARPMPGLRTTVIPQGPYEFPAPTLTRQEMRARLDLPPGARVLLAFGNIRDSKNLDLVLRAMVWLRRIATSLVAGREQSAGQRPAGHYQQLAASLGVEKRCRWVVRRIEEAELGNFFEAADLALLTYAASFRSASAVLNVAVRFRKPCLASGGKSNLLNMVGRYSLGLRIEPDSVTAISAGLRQWPRTAASAGLGPI